MKSWSEAARLYAENHPVVVEMEKAYREDVDQCVAALEEALKDAAKPQHFKTCQKGKNKQQGSRYWWLGDKEAENSAYLWFTNHSRDDIDPDRIVLVGASDNGTDAQRKAIVAAAARLGDGYEVRDKPTKQWLFYLTVDFGPKDFVQPAARRIAEVLKKIHKAFVDAAPRSAPQKGKRK